MRGQAALEFVTTYGWMLLILIIVLGILIYMNFLTPPSPPSCVFPANFVCRAWKLTTDGNLTLDLYQNTNHPIIVRGVNCTKAFVETNPTLTSVYVFIKNDDHELVANGTNVQCLNEDGSVAEGSFGSTYRGKLLIYYVENDTGVPHLVVGSITARYE
ncbi:MAG: hypothetical protein QXF56_05815 [Candidatus Micrarchaeia archaeon]